MWENRAFIFPRWRTSSHTGNNTWVIEAHTLVWCTWDVVSLEGSVLDSSSSIIWIALENISHSSLTRSGSVSHSCYFIFNLASSVKLRVLTGCISLWSFLLLLPIIMKGRLHSVYIWNVHVISHIFLIVILSWLCTCYVLYEVINQSSNEIFMRVIILMPILKYLR